MCFIPFRLVNIHLCQKVASRAERGSRSAIVVKFEDHP